MNQNETSDVLPSAERVRKAAPSPKWPYVFVSVLVAVFICAALLNPSQDRHFEEIDQILARRSLTVGSLDAKVGIHALASYNNYFVFSSVTFGDNWMTDETLMLSYGFFGVVKTTGKINSVYAIIIEKVKELKPN